MVTVIQQPGIFGSGKGLGILGEAIGGAYGYQNQQKQLGILQQAIEGARDESGQLNAQTFLDAALSAGVPMQQIQNYAKIAGIGTKQELSPFQKKVQEKGAERLSELQSDQEKLAQSGAAIERAKQLSEETSGMYALLGYLGIGKAASELNAMGPQLAEPYIDILAKRGAIQESKINRIYENSVPKSSDSWWVQQGKIKNLQKLKYIAEEYNKADQILLQKYQGNVPAEEYAKLNKAIDQAVNELTQDITYAENLNEVENPQKGDKYEDINEKGEVEAVYRYNGKKWTKIPKR